MACFDTEYELAKDAFSYDKKNGPTKCSFINWVLTWLVEQSLLARTFFRIFIKMQLQALQLLLVADLFHTQMIQKVGK